MFKDFCWHKWKYVYRIYKELFLGEPYDKLYKEFRICQKCGKAQEWQYHSGFLCDFWETLEPARTEILKRKIIDKGDYYILKTKGD